MTLEDKIEKQEKIIAESIESVCLCKFDNVIMEKKLEEIIIANKKLKTEETNLNEGAFRKIESKIEHVKIEFKQNFEKSW